MRHSDTPRDLSLRPTSPISAPPCLRGEFPCKNGASRPRPNGLTLIELLVVLAIISVLMTLMFPVLQSARESARRAACASNLRQIGLALHAYHDVQGSFPVGCIDRRPTGGTTQRQLSWCVNLLPFIEQAAAWEVFDMAQPFDSQRNRIAASQAMPILLCPSTNRFGATRRGSRCDDGLGATDYGGLFGATGLGLLPGNGVMRFESATKMLEITDGLDRTIIVAEDTGRGSAEDAQWANGQNIFDVTTVVNSTQHNELWSDHPGGAQVLMCDSVVRFLADKTDLTVLRALCTRGRGDNVPDDLVP